MHGIIEEIEGTEAGEMEIRLRAEIVEEEVTEVTKLGVQREEMSMVQAVEEKMIMDPKRSRDDHALHGIHEVPHEVVQETQEDHHREMQIVDEAPHGLLRADRGLLHLSVRVEMMTDTRKDRRDSNDLGRGPRAKTRKSAVQEVDHRRLVAEVHRAPSLRPGKGDGVLLESK